MMDQYHPLIGRELASKSPLLRISPAVDAARFSLRIDPQHLDAASAVYGLKLPGTIGAMVSSGGRSAACLGPDEWHLIAPLSEQESIARGFAQLYTTVIHSLVDIGHREVGIEIAGEGAVLALQSAIAFDIEAMPVGSACRTLIDKAQIILSREAENRFRIEVWHSFADHVWHLLQAISREVELGI